jgi:hypothetical protein
MIETVVLLAAAAFLLVGGIRWVSSIPTVIDCDLCWSCGQRGQHKLWCPNR